MVLLFDKEGKKEIELDKMDKKLSMEEREIPPELSTLAKSC